jgi:hypothetical protein
MSCHVRDAGELHTRASVGLAGSHRAIRTELPDLRGAVAELAEDLIGVLSERRNVAGARTAQGKANEWQRPDGRVRFAEQLSRLELGVLDDLADRADVTERQPDVPQSLHPARCRRRGDGVLD